MTRLFRWSRTVTDPADRGALRMAVIAIFSILLACGLGLGMAAEMQANDASNKATAACVAYKNIAEAPVTVDPKTGKASVLGLKLLGDFRYAYVKAGCRLGPLSPVDPRVRPYIPKDPSS